MKAVVLREVGGELALEDVPEPEGESVVEVRAAGVNFLDVLVRRGLYPQMPELPHVLGSEVAGDLDGRRVLALPRASGGGYAQRVAVDPRWTFELPDGATYEEGASFLMTFLTAYMPFAQFGERAESVLVHAGAGGVGSAAIQVARRYGCRVVASASSEEKRAYARSLGADETVSYEDLDDVRVDLVVDPVGGEIFERSLRLVNPLGAISAIGFAGGQWRDVNPALIVGRNISVQGVYLGRLMALLPDVVHAWAEELLSWWRAGEVKPAVGHTFALEDAAEAHALIEARKHVGKVVLTP